MGRRKRPKRASEPVRCRVATWNIHGCVGTDGRYDPARVAAVLAGLDADIIGLQEVDWRHPMPGGVEVLDFLGETLGMHAVEGPNLHDHRGRYGNGLLTRLDVEDYRLHSLAYGGREPRGAIDATLALDGGRVRVLVTHLGLKFRERRAQVRTLRALARDGERERWGAAAGRYERMADALADAPRLYAGALRAYGHGPHVPQHPALVPARLHFCAAGAGFDGEPRHTERMTRGWHRTTCPWWRRLCGRELMVRIRTG